MGYGYGYGSSPRMSLESMQAMGPVFALVAFLGFVAVIVFTVIAYRRYIKVPDQHVLNLREPQNMRAFLNFDTLIIERILKVLYVFFSLLNVYFAILAELLLIFVGSVGLNFVETLVGMLLIVVGLLVAEVLLRVGYEMTMLRVIIARNTTQLRESMDKAPHARAPRFSTAAPAGGAPVGDAGAQAAQAQTRPVAAPDSASHVHRQVSIPGFGAHQSPAPSNPICPNCGKELEPGAKFCRFCGHRL